MLALLITSKIGGLMNFLAFCYALAQNRKFAISNLTSPPVFGYCTYNRQLAGLRLRCLNIKNQSNLLLFFQFLSLFVWCFLLFFIFASRNKLWEQHKIFGNTLKHCHLLWSGIGLAVIAKISANKANQQGLPIGSPCLLR